MKEELYTDSPSKAYQAGRMMAVYAKIQTDALGKNLGAGVIQRYYTAASTSPALVLGKLSAMSQYHLSKLDSNWLKEHYLDLLGEIAGKIGSRLPTSLTLEQQSEFALGYYQQRAAMIAAWKAYLAAKDINQEKERNQNGD